MIYLCLNEVVPPVKLSRPVYTTDGRPLLIQGSTLTETYLERLRAFGVGRVWVHDARFADVTDAGFFSPRTSIGLAARLAGICADLHTDRLAINRALDDPTMDLVVDEAYRNHQEPLPVPDGGPTTIPLIAHSVRVCLLTTALGVPPFYGQKEQLRNLALASLLHDLGHAAEPGWREALPEALDQSSRGHTHAGFDIAFRARRLSATVAAACLQHHERADGTGWPRGFHEAAIHPFSRLIAVVERYDHLLFGESPVLPHRALEQIRGEAGAAFDARMVDLFYKRVIPYPPGTPLRLSTGEQAVAVGIEPGSLERPRVRIVSEDGSTRDLCLAEAPDVAVESVSWADPAPTPVAA